MEVKPELDYLDPIIKHEMTADGWRGLTEKGEILEVRGTNGHKVEPPAGDMLVMRGGEPLGYRAIKQSDFMIDDYVGHFNRAARLFRGNHNDEALVEADQAMALAPTLHVRYNRAFILLSVGRWQEGFAEYDHCEQQAPFIRPFCKLARALGVKRWYGEDITGKRLFAVHAHGFGDSIMVLRYVAMLRRRGVDVVMIAPDEFAPLARQVGPVITEFSEVGSDDYFCPMLMLPHFCGATAPDRVAPNCKLELSDSRKQFVAPTSKRRIGIAWSVGKFHDGDYPRAIPLELLVQACGGDSEIHSVQTQGANEAALLGVCTHSFVDFAECAALMATMDQIITVDTAAAHLAGAIEHPNVTVLLSHWASWRWLASWYPTMRICRQAAPGDWASALDAAASH